MRPTLLVYGATGHSGRLVVAEACTAAADTLSVVLGGRDGRLLADLAAGLPGVETRAFGLDDHEAIVQGLAGIDVVVNAAGPFAVTAAALVDACLDAECHYVDINGEIDVYRQLSERARHAARVGVSLVCGAGHSGAAADVLLEAALQSIRASDARPDRFAAVRICQARVAGASAGSIATSLRMLGQPVLVVGERVVRDPTGGWSRMPTLIREPAGRLERTFDFLPGSPGSEAAPGRTVRASAVSLVDTLLMQATLARAGTAATRIESYLEMPGWQRIAYEVGAWIAPLALASRNADSRVASTARFMADEGSPGQPHAEERHAVILEIDSDLEEPLVRWQLDTPNVYALTAQVAVAVAEAVTGASPPDAGWITPSAALRAAAAGDASAALASLRGCHLRTRK